MTPTTARNAGLAACRVCGKLHRLAAGGVPRRCQRCGSAVRSRRRYSLQNTWALLVTGLLLYLPANIFPIMETQTFGRPEENTIISGILVLWEHGSYAIAVVVFLASMVVPVLKFLVLIFLLMSIHRGSPVAAGDKVRLYRLTEVIGPWSMVDVFVVALLVALIQLGGIASVRPGVAIVAFAAMVTVTMLAAMSFDPRLLWDKAEQTHD
ncbi:MAG: paraquat-inducible protein A [Pseudomonadota bacterium]